MDMFSADNKNLKNDESTLQEVKSIIQIEYIIIKQLEELKNKHSS